MKHRLLAIAITLIVFYTSTQTNSQEISESYLKGEWMLGHLDGWYCNVCPNVYFDSGGSGRMVLPSRESREFSFIIAESNIVISFDDGSDFFGSSEFAYELYQNDTLEFLNLTTIEGNHEFTLTREK